MSSWTALTWYTVMETASKTKNMKRESFVNLNIKNLSVIEEYAFKKNEAHYIKELIKLSYSATVELVCIFE